MPLRLASRLAFGLLVMLAVAACQRDVTAPPAHAPSFIVIPGSGTWSTAASVPVLTHGAAGAAVGGMFYVSGGSDDEGGTVKRGILQRYNPSTNSWTTLASMPDSLKYHTAAGLGGRLYVASGLTPTQYCNAHLWRYNPDSNTWTVRAPAPRCHNFSSMVAVGGYLYLIGGSDAADGGLDAVDRYDPATNSWTTVAPLPVKLNSHRAVAVQGRIYVVGGYDFTNSVSSTVAYEYDPGTNTWDTKASFSGVYGGDMNHASAGAIGGIVYLLYGAGASTTTLAYDPALDTWTAVAPHPAGVNWFRATAVIDGSLHLVGGQDTPDGTHDVFTPAFAGNHRPAVSAIARASIILGEAYAAAGSVSDPDDDALTATVQYELAGATSSLTLTANAFTLNHTYVAAGRFQVMVTADDGALSGSEVAWVTVRTPAQTFVQLQDWAAAQVTGTSAVPVADALSRARQRYRRGQIVGAEAALNDAKAALDAAITAGDVTAGNANAMKGVIDRLIAVI